MHTDDFYIPQFEGLDCEPGNWDEPAAFDMDKLCKACSLSDVACVEGIMAFCVLERLLDTGILLPSHVRCILVNTPPELCLARRIARLENDSVKIIAERSYFNATVLPMHKAHCLQVVERLTEKYNIDVSVVSGMP